MASGRGENPQTPHSGEEGGRKSEQAAEARDIDISALDAAGLQKLKEHWQGGSRWKQPGARGLINRIDRRLAALEKEHRAASEIKSEDREAPKPDTAGAVFESPPPATFEMPAGPDEEAAHTPEPIDESSLPTPSRTGPSHPQHPILHEKDEVIHVQPEEAPSVPVGGIRSETELPVEPVGEKEAEGPSPEETTIEQRLAAAEARYHRSLFGLPVGAGDDELRAAMQDARLRRLGIPEHADPEYIQQAEEQWMQQLAALPEISDPTDENQLAPYYALYHVEPGSGYEAIQRARAAARLEQSGLPEPLSSEASGPEQPEPPERAGAEDRTRLWRDLYEGATPDRLLGWLEEDSGKIREREQAIAGKRDRGEEVFGWEEQLLEEERAKFRVLLETAQRKGVDVSAYEAPTMSPDLPSDVPHEGEERAAQEAEQTPGQVVSHPETEPADSAPRERTGGETANAMLPRLIDGALSGAGIRERWGSRKEREILQRAQKGIGQRELSQEEQIALWGALTAIYGRRIEQSDDPDAAIAAAESYRGFLQHGGAPAPAEKNVVLLDALSRHDSPETALRLFHDIRQAAESVTQVTEEPQGVVRSRLADAIGEAWLVKLRQQIQSAEQQETRAHPDPEAFGRLQGIVESPPLPETLVDRLHAATEMYGMLQSRRARPTETEQTREAAQPTTLEQRRFAYARGLQSQSRIFGRTSPEELEQLRIEYQTTIREQVATKIEEIKTALGRTPEGEPVSPEAQSEVQAALVDAVLSSRFEEEQALKESMRSSAEKTATRRFKEFWKKHPKARIAVGLALAGATTASAAHGNILAAGIFQSMRTVVSGASMTMTTEAIWEKSRERWGGTKKLTRTDVSGLSDEELERRIAAHTVADANFESGYYRNRLGRGLTVDMLAEEYRRRKDEALTAEARQMRDAGRTPDEIAEALLVHSMNSEVSHHTALEKRKEANRKDAVKKWSVAIGTGLIAGALTGALGAARLARAAEAATAKEAAGQAGSAAKRNLIERVFGSAEQAGESNAAPLPTEHSADAAATGGQAVESTAGGTQDATEHATGANAAATEAAQTAGTAKETAKAAELYAEQTKDAIIQRGEGIEHALRRQLEAVPEKFGFHGDVTDKAAVHEWSGGEAHRIALREGFASADGSETRVAFDADQASRFVLSADGHVQNVDAETYAHHVPSVEHGEPNLAEATGHASAEATSTTAAQATERATAATTESVPDMTALKEVAPDAFGIDPDIKVAAPDGIQEKLDSYGVRFDGKEIHIGRQAFTLEGASASSVDEAPRTYFTFGEQPSNEVNLSLEDGHLHLRACAVNGQEGTLEIGAGGKIIGMDGVATADGTPVDQIVNGEAFAEARPPAETVDQEALLEAVAKKSAESAITLSKHGREALSAFRATVGEMGKYDRGAMIGIRRAIVDLPARDVLAAHETIEQAIDRQPGGTHEVAVRYTKALAKLFRAIPKNKIRTDETIGSVLNRLARSLDQEQASAIG